MNKNRIEKKGPGSPCHGGHGFAMIVLGARKVSVEAAESRAVIANRVLPLG